MRENEEQNLVCHLKNFHCEKNHQSNIKISESLIHFILRCRNCLRKVIYEWLLRVIFCVPFICIDFCICHRNNISESENAAWQTGMDQCLLTQNEWDFMAYLTVPVLLTIELFKWACVAFFIFYCPMSNMKLDLKRFHLKNERFSQYEKP